MFRKVNHVPKGPAISSGNGGARSMENCFIVGLEGYVTTAVNEKFNGQTVVIAKGDFFRIRWDYDPGSSDKPGKGVHVNAEFGSENTRTKIAFVPLNKPIVNSPDNRNHILFQQVNQPALQYAAIQHGSKYHRDF
ncbi:hypothetical protein BP6252_04471 [Coleophoma cylindrospora]|uniref:Uncharacterized protein n=1 Tax=Coleophoma cylindrospora TaxID=1849047 RepID=A0A3D8S0K3_9HELO|nr:hypothetical protein BP6252_04471 [Coleophoma cylindrospora]